MAWVLGEQDATVQGCPAQKPASGKLMLRVPPEVHGAALLAAQIKGMGEMKEGEIGLYQKRLDFAGNTTGLRVYGRAVSPHEIELCTAASADAAENGQSENLSRIKLE